MFNHTMILESLGSSPPRSPAPVSRPRVRPEPCLPESLPSTGVIQREADRLAPETFHKCSTRSPNPRALEEAMSSSITDSPNEHIAPPSPDTSPVSPSNRFLKRLSWKAKPAKPRGAWTDPEPWQIMRAVEDKDIEFLMEVRNRNFPLLLKYVANASPLIHAMRIGDSHKDIAIILLGTYSRFVNNLEDEDFQRPENAATIRLLKGNLFAAIKQGYQRSQTDLIPSYVQVLVMSEGSKWMNDTVGHVAEALRRGPERQPVERAHSAIRSFALFEFGKAPFLAGLEDYFGNAAVDLLMMAAWSLVGRSIKLAEPIPRSFFARDDRVYKTFADLVFKHRDAIEDRLTGRLKKQLSTLVEVLEGRSLSWSGKVKVLRERLDTHPPPS
ncbi:hypothetical protein BV25DRAFT_1910794 [Artomyces pyxidatus]|uniref:Uncharacterized protein n=1 Tax=Artomyces pyxidatus TaxID=48021 RepID=A0ACB8TL01_9AGAM|nr:hypothetical protein BV25DRAFT_1910794 [Artomyces pyxidatus]